MLLLLGLAAMYVPVYWTAANSSGQWRTEENGHGPIILAVLAWVFWSKRDAVRVAVTQPRPVLGWALLAIGLAVYVFGRVFQVASAEFGSHLFVVSALLLLAKGTSALRAVWFGVAYLVFLIPLPGTVIDATTGVLKQWISAIVEALLYAAGYPIARSGVSLTIGQYELLVADACSGLYSMVSLSALGTLYMYIMARRSWVHVTIMLASILPIAFAANIVRVIVLILITYHFGDEAAQGFLHGAAGLVLMLVALFFFFTLDSLLALLFKQRPASMDPAQATPAR
ncbi:MAG: exosortase B [Rhizobacter sp.]